MAKKKKPYAPEKDPVQTLANISMAMNSLWNGAEAMIAFIEKSGVKVDAKTAKQIEETKEAMKALKSL